MSKEKKLFLVLNAIKFLDKKTTTVIQKTLFIFTKEYDENAFVYVPNHFGPNSFDVRDDLFYLENHNFINVDKKKVYSWFSINEKGLEIMEKIKEKYNHELKILEQICNYVNEWDDDLVKYIYINYPEYTQKSLIAEEILRGLTDDRKKHAEKCFNVLKQKIKEMKNS